MEPATTPGICSVLILKADRLYADALRQQALQVFPQSNATIAVSLDAAQALLSAGQVDVLVTGVGTSMEADVLDLLARSMSQPSRRARHVLVVTNRREYRVLVALRALAVDGVFDSAAEPPEQFANALRVVGEGGRYWSQSMLDHMHHVGSTSTALFRLLTLFEQVVLSVIGDGSDNTTAARKLNLSPATVSTVRRELHRKLGVQHRGELIRMAAQHGFVRFTPRGVIRPGFTIMCAAYEARRAKRGAVVQRDPFPIARADEKS